MEYTFGISVALLVALLGLRHIERRRGRDFLSYHRDQLDRFTHVCARIVRHGAHFVVEFIRRDVVARILHLVSYVALLFVRFLEQRLVRLVAFFRGSRVKGRKQKESTSHLASIERGTGKQNSDVR